MKIRIPMVPVLGMLAGRNFTEGVGGNNVAGQCIAGTVRGDVGNGNSLGDPGGDGFVPDTDGNSLC